MDMSEQVNELAAALAKAQAQVKGAAKESQNPFYKSHYANLESVWDACRKPLTDHGLSVLQSPSTDGVRVTVTTILLHSSGQWIRDAITVTAKDESPQAAGSCISYLKRYVLQSFAGVAPTDDDDAEAAQGRGTGPATQPVPQTVAPPPKGYVEWLEDIRAVSDEGTERLQQAWKESSVEYRNYLTTTTPNVWKGIKAHAAKVSEPIRA